MIDVVVPVFRGAAHTRRCIESVLAASVACPYELVVVDDCSPEPILSAWLDARAEEGRITVLRNLRNLGFVGSVNRGMSLHPGRDVVLLNSDTEVANDWLDRLVACAYSAPDIATVTPFSNNATICSYPFDGWPGDVPGTLGLAELDRLFARVNARAVVDLPTAVGFCMFIRRASLEQLGLFDAQRFGRGYGEENDFSMRAAKAGWRNVLCGDVFVYHRGGVSFGAEKDGLTQRAEKALLEVHPDYDERVAAFVGADPLRALREAVDRARLEAGAQEAAAVRLERLGLPLRRVPVYVGAVGDDAPEPPLPHDRFGKPAVLHVAHSWGGGVERWVRDFALADERGWNLVLRSRTWRNDAGVRIELLDVLADGEPLLAWDLEVPIGMTAIGHDAYRELLAAVTRDFRVEMLIVSSLIGHSLDALDTGLPTAVVLHDLYPYCPALFGWFGKACTTCHGGELKRCVRENPLNVFWHRAEAAEWEAFRDAYAARLAAENVHIVAPSRTVHERYATLFPALSAKPWSHVPHGLAVVPPRGDGAADLDSLAAGSRRMRILVPGRLSLHKGLHLLRELLPELRQFAEVLLLGSGDFGLPLGMQDNVQVIADYAPGELPVRVAEFAPDCALLLSVLPETFSYTLSEMSALGVPVVATRIGAFAERIEDGANGFLVAPEAPAIVECLRSLAADAARLERVARVLRGMPVRTAARMVADYRDLLARGARAAAQAAHGHPMTAGLAAALQQARLRERRLRDERARLSAETAALRQAAQDHSALAARLAQISAALTQAQAENAALTGRVAAVEAQRDAMLRSTSWRVTRPLRAARRALEGKALPPAGEAPEAAGPAADAASAAVGEGPSVAPLVAYRAGDPIARRRAELLAVRGGWAMEEIAADSPATSAGGASLVLGLRSGDGGGLRHARLCFEGGRFAAQSSELVQELDRIVVPSQSVADELASVLGSDAARPTVVRYPLVGNWGNEDRREGERVRRRDLLGLPDATRIIVGIGSGDARCGLPRFARWAMRFAEARNGRCFVWLGAGDGRDGLDGAGEIGVAVALRRLFLVGDREFEPWLLAADAYLGCRDDGVYDAGVVEAIAAGLPVAVEHEGSLADALRCDGLRAELDLVSGEAATARLAEWTEASSAPRWHAARLIRELFGGERAVAEFVAALGVSSDCGNSCTWPPGLPAR